MSDTKRATRRDRLQLARYGAVCVPGSREDGSDAAWFVAPVGRYFKPGTAIYIGDGEIAHERARQRATRLNAKRKVR